MAQIIFKYKLTKASFIIQMIHCLNNEKYFEKVKQQ